VQKDRTILAQLLKNWAQEHNHNFIIASPEPGDDGVSQTGSFLAYVIQQEGTGIDLLTLLDRLELYIDRVRGRGLPDGMFCRKCRSFYKYAEPNQPDGTLLCYSCRSSPYT
jgi:hypothetical protein